MAIHPSSSKSQNSPGTLTLGVSAITRAEVILGMRDSERASTFELLDSLRKLTVDASIADRAGEIIRDFRRRGITLHLPDALIGATAILASAPLLTGNARHYPSPDRAERTRHLVQRVPQLALRFRDPAEEVSGTSSGSTSSGSDVTPRDTFDHRGLAGRNRLKNK